MTVFSPVADLKIGHIVEVSGTTVKVELSGAVSELSRTYSGRVYDIGQIGSVVKIHFGRRVIFGFVTLLRMRSEELAEAGHPIPPDADQRVMEIDLFAEGSWSTAKGELRFQRGISTYPLPRQSVYILTQAETTTLYEAAERQHGDGADPLVAFAKYVGADNTICHANIDKMFSTHCAILGSTGSGKSGAVAALLHSIIEHKPDGDRPFHPRIIIIDPHGEYGKAFGDKATVYRAYDPIAGGEVPGLKRIVLPYWLMSAEEFRSLLIGKTEHEATSQHNVVYKALTHARMVAAGLVHAAPTAYGRNDPADGLALDEPRPLTPEKAAGIAEFDRDKPRPFSLDEFWNHIAYAQAARIQGVVTARVTETDFAKSFKSILDKLSVLRRDPRIKFLMENWDAQTPSLGAVVAQLVGNDPGQQLETSIRVIDISGLPNEVAGPLTAMIARILFLYKLYQNQTERESDPLLLVCEEAHRYVPDRGEAEYAAAQSAVRRIAREGRKYGLGLMLVSQRPADIESTVIAQCGTWLVLRLTNSADQQHVARFLPDGLSGMVRALPALAQQEALFVGEGASLPARIRIRDLTPDELPKSASISYAKGWLNDRLPIVALNQIAERMST